MQKILVKNKDIIWRTVQGEAVLLDPQNGQYFGLNAVASSFWEKIDGVKTLEEIIDLLIEEYRVERDVLVNDIEELVLDLKGKGLLLIS